MNAQFLRNRHIALLLLLSLVACAKDSERGPGASVPSEPVRGGTLTIAADTEPDVLNSLITTSGYSGRINSLMNDGLLAMNRQMEFEPVLAESWAWSDDGLELTFRLHRDIKWNDGHLFWARDVVRSYELHIDPRVKATRISNFADIESITAPDSFTVVMRYKRRTRDELFNAVFALFPSHIVDELDPEDVSGWPINREPVGTGAWKLVRWDAGEQIVLERNPYYRGEPAYLDRIVFKFTPDPTVRMLRLEAGEVDMLERIDFKGYERLKRNPDVEIYSCEGRFFAYLQYNLANPFLADARVRRAISLAVDRSAFVDNLLYGRGQPAASIIPPVLAWAHKSDLTPDTVDLDAARGLLASAGFADTDGNGVLERDGQEFEIEVKTRTGDPVRENGILVLQENLGRVGIKVKLRLMESKAVIDEVRAGKFDVHYGHFRSRLSVDPSLLVSTEGHLNYGGFSNARMDELIREGLTEIDEEKARRIWYEFQDLFAAEQPWTMLYYYDELVVINRQFQDCTPHILSPLYGVEGWWKVPAES